jgi:plasmid stabilization system protein ParE
MKVTIGAAARVDLADIGDRIATDNPLRAFSFVEELETRCFALDHHADRFPIIGNVGPSAVHKLTHGRYLIFYQIERAEVTVLRIIHGARDWAGLFDA